MLSIANASVLRANTIQMAVDHFKEIPFKWGEADCAHLLSFILTRLGHPCPIARLGPYDSPRTCLREMTRAGMPTMADEMDRLGFKRIAPIEAIQCDIIGYQSDIKRMTTLGVALGDDRAIAFLENGFGVGPLSIAETAWRIEIHPDFVPPTPDDGGAS
jgi:hypothetical protein